MNMSKIMNKPWKLTILVIVEIIVFSIALWISILVAPSNEALHNAVLILCVFVLGFTIVLYGNAVKNRIYNMLGFAFFLFAVFIVIDRFEGFAVKISAFAALLVAFAAFMSIEESRRLRDDNRRIREEIIVQERQESASERIRSWAEETFEVISQGMGHGFEGIRPTAIITQERLRLTKRQLLPSFVKSIGMGTEAIQLDGDVAKEVALATQSLLRHIGRLGMEKDIVQFREFVSDTDLGNELVPYGSLEEVTKAEQEVLDHLKKVIYVVTKVLTPSR